MIKYDSMQADLVKIEEKCDNVYKMLLIQNIYAKKFKQNGIHDLLIYSLIDNQKRLRLQKTKGRVITELLRAEIKIQSLDSFYLSKYENESWQKIDESTAISVTNLGKVGYNSGFFNENYDEEIFKEMQKPGIYLITEKERINSFLFGLKEKSFDEIYSGFK